MEGKKKLIISKKLNKMNSKKFVNYKNDKRSESGPRPIINVFFNNTVYKIKK